MSAPDFIDEYARIHANLHTALDALDVACSEAKRSEIPVPTEAQYATQWTKMVDCDCDTRKARRAINSRLRREIESIAARRFAPPGITALNINPDEYEKAADKSTLGPRALWRALETVYGGAAGAKTAYSEAAINLIRHLCIAKGGAVKRKAGRVILNADVGWDDLLHSAVGGGRRLDYYSEKNIHAIQEALAAVYAWAGEAAPVIIRWGFSGRELVSRERIEFSPDIRIVTYFTRFEFQFSERIFAQIQSFIASCDIPEHVWARAA